MIVDVGERVHVVYRALYENSGRRHFIGEIQRVSGTECRIEGYVFVYDPKSSVFNRKPEKRVTIMDLAESGYIVNLMDKSVKIEDIKYQYLPEIGLVATDGKGFTLNINEFGAKS